MKTLYEYDYSILNYKPIESKYLIRAKTVIVLLLIFLSLGYFLGNRVKYKNFRIHIETSIESLPTPDLWRDSVFTDYELRAELYLQKFPNTPIKAEMLSLAAQNAYDSTGILLPVELALTQAQVESSMGTRGKSPKNNPYNVGEYDSGTVIRFNSTFDGIQAYYYLMCINYLSCKSIDELFKNFTNCNGHRYASNPVYENKIKNQFHYTKRSTNKKIKELKDIKYNRRDISRDRC